MVFVHFITERKDYRAAESRATLNYNWSRANQEPKQNSAYVICLWRRYNWPNGINKTILAVTKYNIIWQQNKPPGPVFQKLQENSKHDILDPIITSKKFALVTVVAKSYHKGAEPKQSRLVCLTNRHKVEEINLLRQMNKRSVLSLVAKAAWLIIWRLHRRPMSE